MKVLGIEFKTGSQQNHPKFGAYTIMSIMGDKMKVRFNNGEVKELTISITAQMIFNQQNTSEKTLPKKVIGKDDILNKKYQSNYSDKNFSWTIGALARKCKIKVIGVRNEKVDELISEYRKNTGSNIQGKINCCDNSTKWGLELSVIIPQEVVDNFRFCLPEYCYIEYSTLDKTTQRINNNKFAWTLISYGFDINKEHNVISIKELAENLDIESFEKGLKVA